MNTNQITNNKEFTVQIAPWFEQLMEAKAASACVSERKAIQPEEINIDETTGKKYALRFDKNGRKIRIPVGATYEADDPIWDKKDVQRLGSYLYNRKGHKATVLRDYAYFVLSINTWRRAGDNLSLRICDVMNPDRTIKQYLKITEQKTQKHTQTFIDEDTKAVLKEYLMSRGTYKMTDYLFPNPHPKYDTDGNELPLEVQAMRRMLQRAAKAIRLDESIHIGTHTLRKTGAYHALKNATTISEMEEIVDILGHSSLKVTQRYVRVAQRERDEFLDKCHFKIAI